MRLFIFGLISLVFTQLLVAQNTFKMVLTSSGYDQGVAAFRTSDKGYRVIGNTSAYGNGGKDVWVIALDSNANFLWQKTYGFSFNEEATSAALNNQNQIVIIGNVTNSIAQTVNYFLLFINHNGDILLNEQYGSADWDMASAVSFFGDSTFLVSGSSYNGPLSGQSNPMLSRIHFNGNLLWTSYLGSGQAEKNTDICFGKNQEIFVSGHTLTLAEEPDSAFIKSFDNQGNMVWQSVMPQWKGSLQSLIRFEDSMIVGTGFRFDTLNPWREPIIVKAHQTGDFVLLQDEKQNGDSYFSDIISDSTGMLIVTGFSTVYTQGLGDIYTGKFDWMGYWHAGSTVGGTSEETPGNIVFSSCDSTYLSCGTTKSFGVPYSAILLNQMDMTTYFDTTTVMSFVSSIPALPQKPLVYKVFPNPAQDFLTIDFGKNVVKGNLLVCDLSGKILIETNDFNGKSLLKINLSSLKPGQYFVKNTINNQVITTRFIKN